MTRIRSTSTTPQTRRRGFTLTEAIASMVILSIVGLTSSQILLTTSRGFTDAADHLEMQAELSAAVHRIAQAIRGIGRESSSSSAPDITSLSVNEIRWPRGSIGLTGDVVTLSTGVSATEPLRSGVTERRLEAFDDEGAALAGALDDDAADAVRFLRFTVSASWGDQSASLTTGVFIRSTAATFGD